MKKAVMAVAIVATLAATFAIAAVSGKLFLSATNTQEPNSASNISQPQPNPTGKPESQPLNFVIILTDDQRWDTLWAMPNVQNQLVTKGVNFKNSFVTTPLCCPARASLISGGYYPFNTGVLTNTLPNGGAEKFEDSMTMATLLQQKGYKTGLVGKYLNEYTNLTPYIPPGWSTFVTTYGSDWNDYTVVSGSSNYDKGAAGKESKATQYITYYARDRGLDFIEENADWPFFLLLSFNAPHKPATPAEEDRNAFSKYVYQSPGTLEQDLSDKPPSVRDQSDRFSGDEEEGSEGNTLFTEEAETAEEFFRDQLGSLQAVDRSIGAIMNKISDEGVLDRTVFIFTSDNGYMWGEHGLYFKAKPYEESIRVPLVIRLPDVPPGEVGELVAMNLDVPTTILNLTGIDKKTDGLNLYPLINQRRDDQINRNQTDTPDWRDYLVFQSFGETKNTKGWAALRTQDWKYIERANGEIELYDIVSDPHELENLYGVQDLLIQERIDTFSEFLKPLTALTISTFNLPKAEHDQPYFAAIDAKGGVEPYTWKLHSGILPDGLTLSREGVISGVPSGTVGFDKEFEVIVTDSSLNTQSGKPQSYVARFIIRLSE